MKVYLVYRTEILKFNAAHGSSYCFPETKVIAVVDSAESASAAVDCEKDFESRIGNQPKLDNGDIFYSVQERSVMSNYAAAEILTPNK